LQENGTPNTIKTFTFVVFTLTNAKYVQMCARNRNKLVLGLKTWYIAREKIFNAMPNED